MDSVVFDPGTFPFVKLFNATPSMFWNFFMTNFFFVECSLARCCSLAMATDSEAIVGRGFGIRPNFAMTDVFG